jgi:hypothetical protein
VDVDAVRVAVGEVGRILRADGGDLLLVEANPATRRVRLALRLEDVLCADCILPPDELEQTIRLAIERRVPGELELLLDDPRR